MTLKKRGLGKSLSDLGLNELLSNVIIQPSSMSKKNNDLIYLPVHLLRPGSCQPRRMFNQTNLQELADSIKAHGIIQPLIARPVEEHYEIVSGERRWRAAQLAQLKEIPVLVRDVANETAIAIALIENLQRENLNVIEEALAFQRLIEECHMTHQEIAQQVGKSRTAISNILRLLKLNSDVQAWLEQGMLDMGHARALLSLNTLEQTRLAQQMITKKLSVREAENLVNAYLSPVKQHADRVHTDPDIQHLQNRLSDLLGASVVIQNNRNGKGKLIIRYNSVEELEGVLGRIAND